MGERVHIVKAMLTDFKETKMIQINLLFTLNSGQKYLWLINQFTFHLVRVLILFLTSHLPFFMQ